ncbi:MULTISPECIES: TetR/AcrR family transcriptional regulator [unclassified Gordonia (in: high G+C Gram-positive bacteria)]
MARPRREEQDVLVDRIAATLSERQQLQPWTLAEISPAVGLSPAGLIKRFGSRSGVLQALSRRWIDSIPGAPHGVVPVEDELRAWVAERFIAGGSHAVAYGLVNLVDDLIDDSLRPLLVEGWGKEISYLSGLLRRLELPGLRDPTRGAALLFDALHGSMLRSAALPDPTAASRTLDELLGAWT